jgi:hypothetical protein
MKQIKINAYEFKELNQDAKHTALLWLDEFPLEYETEELNEQGKPILKNEYFSDWLEEEVQEHCEMNNYLFSKQGKCVHHLETKKGQNNENKNI